MSRGRKHKTRLHTFRSGLEKVVGDHLNAALIPFLHESEKLKYVVPESSKTYNPDFTIPEAPHLIVEAKGIFSAADRKKMVLIKQQYPERQILMVFGRARNFLRKGSKTTYADWCDKNEIKWVDLADFIKDPRRCLSLTTKKKENGRSPISHLKKLTRSSRSVRKLL